MKVKSLEKLRELVEKRKAVEVEGRGVMPAAWVWQMPAHLVWGLMERGMKVYEKKKPEGRAGQGKKAGEKKDEA